MDAGDYFNPRTPCGVRLPCTAQEQLAWKFQSTHPLRGATIHVMQTKSPLFISIHAPLAGCDPPRRGDTQTRGISIHAPLAGCDRSSIRNSPPYRDFNPRTPCGVRPRVYSNTYRKSRISIHAPLAGCDGGKPAPRPRLNVFQSTHPLRGATAKLPKYSRKICAKATKFLQSQTKSGVAACWAKGKQPLFPALRGANLPGKTGTLPVRIR